MSPYITNGVHADGSWQHPNGSSLGRYFKFDVTEWKNYFGSFTSGQVLSIKQCRGDKTIYTGEVRVWEGEINHNGRRNPLSLASGGDWLSNDYIVKPTEDCVTRLPKVQKVKIQHDQSSSEPLNICEVEVYDDTGTNQALSKPALQSSDYGYHHGVFLGASLAVDGNKASDNFSHTNNGSGKFCWLLL